MYWFFSITAFLKFYYSGKKANFLFNVISNLHFTIHKLYVFYLSCKVTWYFEKQSIYESNSLVFLKFWFKGNVSTDVILPNKSITNKWDHSNLTSMYLHGNDFLDICFETAAPDFKNLNQFISLSNTNSNVYQISLRIELYWCSFGVFPFEKMTRCWCVFSVHLFFFWVSISFFLYHYEILKFPFNDALRNDALFFLNYARCKK